MITTASVVSPPSPAKPDPGAAPPQNISCPMRCQSPALPHCHSFPLATRREHCIIITCVIVIISIIWGCPCPRGPVLLPVPQPCQPQCLRASLTAISEPHSRGTHKGQHLPAPWQHPSRSSSVEASQNLGCQHGWGDRKDLPPKACPGPAVTHLSTSLLSQILH